MGLDIKNMDYGVLYKFLDEREAYFTNGVWYISKYNNPKSSTEPIIYVHHFDLNGKIICTYCGNIINYSYQNGVEFTIKGWKIDKDSPISNVGKSDTMEELSFSMGTLTPVPSNEKINLNVEILNFLENPKEYLKQNSK